MLLNPTVLPLGLADPIPPAGSDYDQSTLSYPADTAYVVAGAINGDSTHECYMAQGFKNQRANLTGFGVILGLVGTVTNNLYVLISDGLKNPNDPSSTFITGGMIEPSKLTPGSSYYVYWTLTEPVQLTPGTQYYMIVCTDEPYVESPQSGWFWTGISTGNVYANGMTHAFNGQSWANFTEIDMSFWTWTQTGGATCSDYTSQSTCEAAGCYWYDSSCHSTPQGTCDSYTTQSSCENAGCYWYDGGCHSDPQDKKCSSYTIKATCEANGCFWYKKYFWEEEKCYEKEQDMMMDYLPIIVAGVGGIIIIGALLSKGQPAYPPYPYYPPPQPYYPPPQQPQYYPQYQ